MHIPITFKIELSLSSIETTLSPYGSVYISFQTNLKGKQL